MLTLVLGGARSGKSRHAQELCGDARVRYIATAPNTDDEEMHRRIELHRDVRPKRWETVEEPIDVLGAVKSASPGAVVLLDCATLWLSNLLFEHRALSAGEREQRIITDVQAVVDACSARKVIVVSNDVGSGVVPADPIAREFRDLQGRANQVLAVGASRVLWMVAGIPTVVKDESSA